MKKGIPIYTFVLKQMLYILPIWKDNPDADFSIVDNKSIFSFIEDVREKSGLWCFPFESANDIKITLKSQFSFLLNTALQDRRKIQKLGYNDLYSKISPKALNILLSKKEQYEFLFLFQCMRDEIDCYKYLYYDYNYSVILKSTNQIKTGSQYSDWVHLKIGELLNIINSLNNIFRDAMQTFLAERGTPSDIYGLYYTANTYGRLYAALMQWSIDVLSTVVIDELKDAQKILFSMSKPAILAIEEYPKQSIKTINSTMGKYNTSTKSEEIVVRLFLELSIEDELKDEHSVYMN